MRAQELLLEVGAATFGHTYTSDFVFDEAMTLIAVRTKGNRLDLLEKMGTLFLGLEPIAEMLDVPMSSFSEIAALQKKMNAPGEAVSFTDCSNIVLCQKCKIPQILSFDGHFEGYLIQIK